MVTKIRNKKEINYYKYLKNASFNNLNREVYCKSVIMLYNFDQNGDIKFFVGEILNQQTGSYVILKTGEVRQFLPFKFHDAKTGTNFEDIERGDNIIFQEVGHMESSRVSRIYSLARMAIDLQLSRPEPIVDEFTTDKIKYFTGLQFPTRNKYSSKYNFFFMDKSLLFDRDFSTVSDWLDFEKKFNLIYRRDRNIGKNYLQEDERNVEDAKQTWKKEMRDFEKKVMKNLGKEFSNEGNIEEAMFP